MKNIPGFLGEVLRDIFKCTVLFSRNAIRKLCILVEISTDKIFLWKKASLSFELNFLCLRIIIVLFLMRRYKRLSFRCIRGITLNIFNYVLFIILSSARRFPFESSSPQNRRFIFPPWILLVWKLKKNNHF